MDFSVRPRRSVPRFFFARLAERSNRRRNTYDEAIRFLAEYRVQATSDDSRSLNTPLQLLSKQCGWTGKSPTSFRRKFSRHGAA
jgi:hypothetical protein